MPTPIVQTMRPRRRRLLGALSGAGALALLGAPRARATTPILIGLDAELRDRTSTSDDAIRLGIESALEELNRAGGLLGRPLQLEVRDNRSVPARGVANAREFAAIADMPAFFCGKFSPVALEQVGAVHGERLLLLDPWAAADRIIDNGLTPNCAFRLSLRDSWAMSEMLRYLRNRGIRSAGVLAPQNAWGRSSVTAAREQTSLANISVDAVEWYQWGGERTLMEQYLALQRAGVEALLLVANEADGALLVRELAALPASARLPIASHWGVTGGRFAELCGPALQQVDFAVVQTYAFDAPRNGAARRLAQRAQAHFGVDHPGRIPSAVGLAHAYDLTHLLALAITRAGSLDRERVRDALEQLPPYEGVIKRYAPAFSPSRHEALSRQDVFLARYSADGRLQRLGRSA